MGSAMVNAEVSGLLAVHGARCTTGNPWRTRVVQRLTLPALRHDVHTFNRFGVTPVGPTFARTFWMLGIHRREVRRWECEIWRPKLGPLPQTSQCAATVCSSKVL